VRWRASFDCCRTGAAEADVDVPGQFDGLISPIWRWSRAPGVLNEMEKMGSALSRLLYAWANATSCTTWAHGGAQLAPRNSQFAFENDQVLIKEKHGQPHDHKLNR